MRSNEKTKDQILRRPGGRSARVREAVLAATVAELRESGFAGLNLAAVARRAGVHETSIYRRWKTRNALVMDATFALFAQNVKVRDRGSLVEDLVAVLSALGRHLRTPLGRAAFESAMVVFDDPMLSSELGSHWNARFKEVGEIFTRAAQRGEWPSSRAPEPLLQSLIGAVYLRVFLFGLPVGPAQIRALVEDLTGHHGRKQLP
jgi:AcrR family transcriptional regulator